MNSKNVSSQMHKRFHILDEMIEKGYIETIKPKVKWLPSLCFSPKKTSEFNHATQEIQKEFKRNMFSIYAFFLSGYAFTQTKLEKDYFIVASIYYSMNAGIYAIISNPMLNIAIGLSFQTVMSQAFVFSRYYQYNTYDRCPSNRSVFSTICLLLIYGSIAQIPAMIIYISLKFIYTFIVIK
ncbi:hypothetical protein [Anabaena catenula]|uniref:Uncharacterized protein n=1 Tax=Anabaena catenula FACHB-362 TaxID=2692877 RepID=A0ABR8J993_9NOST|nr:hypothetical protein [Anabaena catenula]MBD2694907.1 hypothetical protein [Anabaena catenula FACHB-362]